MRIKREGSVFNRVGAEHESDALHSGLKLEVSSPSDAVLKEM
jgi:hypothetical protein